MLHWGTEYPIIVRSVKQIDSILKGFLMKKIIIVAIAFLFLSGCADKVILDPNSISDDIGFFYGLWHGLIIVWSLITSLFDDGTAIYSIYNNGPMYDWGFLIGSGSVGTGIKIVFK